MSNEELRRLLGGFSQRHPEVFEAYERLTEEAEKRDRFQSALKLLWFEHVAGQDHFNREDATVLRFMRQSAKEIPVIEIDPKIRQVFLKAMDEQKPEEEPDVYVPV